MSAKPSGYYYDVLAIESGSGWTHPEGEPEGVSEFTLNRHADGSYTHLLRVKKGTVFPEPVLHEFYEEAYYVHGEMLNTKTKKKIKGGAYVFHKSGEEHGPFRCLKTCLILEFRYYK
jgi:hypothetical protein